MSSSGVDAVNSGPILLRTYNDNSANNSYVLGRYDIPIPSNYVLITSTNGVIVPSDNITISNITINSITYLDGTVSISDNSILYPVANPPPLSFIPVQPGYWLGVAMSASGQYQTALDNGGDIYRSVDYGVTWTSIGQTTLNIWSGIAMSASGQYQTAFDNTGNIYRSIDYGATWPFNQNISGLLSIAMSASGQFQTAVSNTIIYRSIDYGVTWALAFTNSNSWESIAISASGQYQTAVGLDIYYSTDYGVAWISTGLSDTYFSVAMSSSGQYQTAVSLTNIYTVKPTIAPVNTNNIFLIPQGQPLNPTLGQICYNVGTNNFYGCISTGTWKEFAMI